MSRQKKKLHEKLFPGRIQEKVVCAAQLSRKVPNVCGRSASGKTLAQPRGQFPNLGGRRRDPAHQVFFSRPDTRTTSASHLGNTNAPWAAHRACAALRNATATVIVAAATTTILQCNSNNFTPVAAHMSGAGFLSP